MSITFPPTGLLWPLLLCSIFLIALLASVVCIKFEVLRSAITPEPAAFAEASIAICSGALLWIGWWDFMDSYLVPTAWWAKLCMLCVGALGAVWTRSLYAEAPPRHSIRSAEGTSMCLDDDIEDPPAAPRDGPSQIIEALSPRPRSFGQPSEEEYDEALANAVRGTPGQTPGRPGAQSKRRGSHRAAEPSDLSGSSGGTLWSRFCFLNPPRFSCSRCSRALLATFSGLTMWVGLWDLIETHILPTLFSSCSHEPSTGCAVVKLSLVGIGALGLYVTRSLYGDSGSVGAVQFQRL